MEQLQRHLIERFEEMEKRLTPSGPQVALPSPPCTSITSSSLQINLQPADNLEPRLVETLERFTLRPWRHDAGLLPGTVPRRMTILHLVAALGFTKLLSKLTEWKSRSLSLVLEAEMDPVCLDEASSTPLVSLHFPWIFLYLPFQLWACARGHFEMAVILYQMNNSCLAICNRDGLLPITLCRMCRHDNLADVLEKLETARREMVLMKNEAKQEEEVKCARQPIQMTLVKTSTGMMLTPLVPDDTKPRIPVHVQQPSTMTLELSRSPSDSLSINIPQDEAAERRQRLLKRTSVEVLPDYPNPRAPVQPELSAPPVPVQTSSPVPHPCSPPEGGLRMSSSDPHLAGLSPCPADPMISMSDRDLNSPVMFMQTEQPHEGHRELVAMETGEPLPPYLVLC